jgi:hypothetical protein
VSVRNRPEYPSWPVFGRDNMVFSTFFHAARSVISGFCRPRRDQPGTSLRTLCVAAFDFTARTDGQRLGPNKRKALNSLLDLGALINDHYDEHQFCKSSYRRLRKRLAADETARAVYRDYFRRLRHVERNRPHLQLPCQADSLKQVADYREDVVQLSLSALAAIALGQPSRADLDDTRPPPAKHACLSHLIPLVMLLQVCDDLLDWRNDWRRRLPSFVTAALLQCQEQTQGHAADLAPVRINIDAATTTYLATMPGWNRTFWPFTLSTYAALLLAKLLAKLALCELRFRKQPTGLDLTSCRSVLDVAPRECRKHAISLED